MLKRYSILLLALIVAAMMLVNCKPKGRKSASDADDDEAPKKVKYASKSDEGEIKGVIKFDGTAPDRAKIDISQDANCVRAEGDKLADDVLVDAGKLQNVFVYLKGGPADRFDFGTPSDAVVLDQHGCRYTPRILGVQVGQTLEITNSDQTTHNVHPTPKNNPEWNKVQSAGQAPFKENFKKAETLIQVKCNQHPWMTAHVGVLGHPFFAVSAKDGTFTIKNVPPGKYTLIAYHEKLGEKQMSIDVAAKESKVQDFTFSPKAAFIPTSLSVEPALIVP
jgi:plastocyanin